MNVRGDFLGGPNFYIVKLGFSGVYITLAFYGYQVFLNENLL